MERVSKYQLFLMGSCYIFVATLISLPAQIIGVVNQDAWMVYPVVLVAVLPMVWILTRVTARFPKRDLFDVLVSRRPVLGRIFALLYVLFFLLILARDLRMTIDFIDMSLLPHTPLYVTSLLVVFTIALVVRSGTEVLARMNELFFPVLVLVIVLIPLLTLNKFRMEYAQPVFEYGLRPLFEGSWLAFPYIGEIVILPFLLTRQTITFKQGFYSVLLGSVLLELLIIANVLTLGSHLSSHLLYPNFETIRQIRLTDFLDRFDLLLVMIYLPPMIIKLCMSLYVICLGIRRMLPKSPEKIWPLPLAAFAHVCTFLFFENTIQLLQTNYVWPVLAVLFEVVIPVLLWIAWRPKPHAPQQDQPATSTST